MKNILKILTVILLYLFLSQPPGFCDGFTPLNGISIELNITFGKINKGDFGLIGWGLGMSIQSTNFINPCFRINFFLEDRTVLYEFQGIFGNKIDGFALAAGITFVTMYSGYISIPFFPCGISFGPYYKNFFCVFNFTFIGLFAEPGYSIFIPFP